MVLLWDQLKPGLHSRALCGTVCSLSIANSTLLNSYLTTCQRPYVVLKEVSLTIQISNLCTCLLYAIWENVNNGQINTFESWVLNKNMWCWTRPMDANTTKCMRGGVDGGMQVFWTSNDPWNGPSSSIAW